MNANYNMYIRIYVYMYKCIDIDMLIYESVLTLKLALKHALMHLMHP